MPLELVVFQKHSECAPGTWWWIKDDTSGPTVSCRKCQKLHGLNHLVKADGTVDPSLLCTRCGDHVNGKLDGWTYGEINFYKDN